MPRFHNAARRLACVLAAGVALGLLATLTPAAVSIDLVTVGDPGNAGEVSGQGVLYPGRVCGAVDYVYQIGTYEVTGAQYRAFLNSVAQYSDPYALYRHPAGILRTGTGTASDPYVYIPKDNDPNWDPKPANDVSWHSSLRFINWLQNGQPVAEAGPGVTETGTYTFTDPSTVSIPDHASLTEPTWVLPTEDEWYKSAYYKGGGTSAGYWDYPTQSDTHPDNNPPDLDTGNSANYGWHEGDPNTGLLIVHITAAGAYSLSEGAYGTYDQGGNVSEWVEEILDGGRPLSRGGGYGSTYPGLAAPWRDLPSLGDDDGFRVGMVPEPITLWVAGAGWFAVCIRRTRRMGR